MISKALTIAGSDSGGGAGIQADLKAFSALGVYGCSAITAITAQNTRAVTDVVALEKEIIGAQIDAVLSDIEIHAVKIGMLFSAPIIETVAARLRAYKGPIVLDPVMIAKSGDALLQDEAITAMIDHMLPLATIVTPNIPELARLTSDDLDPAEQAVRLRALGAKAVLMKGGHAKGDICSDILIDEAPDPLILQARRIETKNTHGTGCTLSSAIAAELAKGQDLRSAVSNAHAYVHAAIVRADALNVGGGHGPVHHFHALWPADDH